MHHNAYTEGAHLKYLLVNILKEYLLYLLSEQKEKNKYVTLIESVTGYFKKRCLKKGYVGKNP